ncbi:sigma factor regulatory protein, FecR/PupR family [Pseudomonas synxantha BG33R]|uniref:DUF4880 domain-containing protein n=1 Tax=Pseudomonas synxantha TaxID=47883 RepID=UPI00025FEB37|nr:DUF4880 domain-containing protein [Pseudomonas synxantha]EIK67836.1 sigma factor regulatory protein, FecR/PupR family [Pseudomonas synxantha BG33R]
MSTDERDDPLLEEAIEWMAQIQSGAFDSQQQRALERWRGQSPRHAQVFDQLLKGLAAVQASPWRGRTSTPLLRALKQPSSRRRFIGNSLGMLGVALGAGLFGRWCNRARGCLVSGRPVPGERRHWQLDDGSRLELNARSRVLPRFFDQQRALVLRKGTLLLDIAENTVSSFEIATAVGVVHSQAGRLQVGEEGVGIRLLTLQGVAFLRLPNGENVAVPGAHSLLFDAHGVLSRAPLQPGEGSWASGWLEVNDKPLSWVTDAFRPYLPGLIMLDDRIKKIRVNGLFPLDDITISLDMLEQSLPVEVVRYSDYWISIISLHP